MKIKNTPNFACKIRNINGKTAFCYARRVKWLLLLSQKILPEAPCKNKGNPAGFAYIYVYLFCIATLSGIFCAMFPHFLIGVMCLFLFGRMLILFKRLDGTSQPRVLRELIILFMITFTMPFLVAYFFVER